MPGPEGNKAPRRMKMDSGSDFDLVNNHVLDELQIPSKEIQKIEDDDPGWEMQSICPEGAILKPLGKVILEWHIAKDNRTYKTTFYIIDDSAYQFDLLVGEPFIRQNGFLLRNPSKWPQY
jgi:hypothetical protein